MAARCVRVIHAQCVLQFALLSRTLLRSSSNNEPSDPPYRIIFFVFFLYIYTFDSYSMTNNNDFCWMERFKTRDKLTIEEEKKGLRKEHFFPSCYICHLVLFYIMVRHNHHIHEIVRSYMFLFMIEINQKTVMIHTQVHLRIPCYDFYFL